MLCKYYNQTQLLMSLIKITFCQYDGVVICITSIFLLWWDFYFTNLQKKLYDKLVSHCTGISIIIHENVATGILTCGIFHECETLCETIDFFLKNPQM